MWKRELDEFKKYWKVAVIFSLLALAAWGVMLLPFSGGAIWLRQIFLTGFLVLFLTWPFWLAYLGRAGRRRMVGTRESLSEEEIYNRYYRDSGIPFGPFCDTWRLVAHDLRVEPGKLRPDDALDALNGIPAWVDGWSSTFGDAHRLSDRMEDAAMDASTTWEREPETLDDVIRYLARHASGAD
jgi:hypothetical protein